MFAVDEMRGKEGARKEGLHFKTFFQNLLFYYDHDTSNRPTGVIFLEGCYCERILSTSNKSEHQLHTADGGPEKMVKIE